MDATLSKITLANYAASKIGAKSFTFQDGSSASVVFGAIYDICRETVLEECPWTFAVNTVSLQTISIASTIPQLNFGDNIKYAYALPSDYLKLIAVNYPGALIKVENLSGVGPVLFSDTSGLIIKYIYNNDNPASYSPKFYEALACKLAAEACFKLVEAQQYTTQMKAEYEKALITAAASDGQISSAEVVNDGYWEWARLAGSNAAVGYNNGQNVGLYPYPGITDF